MSVNLNYNNEDKKLEISDKSMKTEIILLDKNLNQQDTKENLKITIDCIHC